jgi:hypothetical protein
LIFSREDGVVRPDCAWATMQYIQIITKEMTRSFFIVCKEASENKMRCRAAKDAALRRK